MPMLPPPEWPEWPRWLAPRRYWGGPDANPVSMRWSDVIRLWRILHRAGVTLPTENHQIGFEYQIYWSDTDEPTAKMPGWYTSWPAAVRAMHRLHHARPIGDAWIYLQVWVVPPGKDILDIKCMGFSKYDVWGDCLLLVPGTWSEEK